MASAVAAGEGRTSTPADLVGTPQGVGQEEWADPMQDGLGRVQRLALVGARSDLGRAVVDRLIADGGVRSVVLLGRGDLTPAADPLRARGIHVELHELDVTAPDAAGRARAALDAGPDVDVVVFAVGQLRDETGSLADPAVLEMAAANFGGAVGVLAAAGEVLAAQGHGTLVVLSSVAGQRARADNPVYAGSKAGLDAFALGLRLRLRPTGATVVVVRPGFVHTAMTDGLPPAPFATTADRVAEDTVRALRSGRAVAYSPGLLRWVFAVLRRLPDPVWAALGRRQQG